MYISSRNCWSAITHITLGKILLITFLLIGQQAHVRCHRDWVVTRMLAADLCLLSVFSYSVQVSPSHKVWTFFLSEGRDSSVFSLDCGDMVCQ